MIVWGEENQGIEVNTGRDRYNPVGNTWLPTSLTNAPTRRAGEHSSVEWQRNDRVGWL